MSPRVFLATVNTRIYKIHAKSPLELMTFSPKAVHTVCKALNGSPLIENFDASKLTQDNAVATLLPEFLRMSAQLDPAEVTELMQDVFRSPILTEEDQDLSDPQVFDSHFSAYPQDLMQVALWSVLHNATLILFENVTDFLPTVTADSE